MGSIISSVKKLKGQNRLKLKSKHFSKNFFAKNKFKCKIKRTITCQNQKQRENITYLTKTSKKHRYSLKF